MNILLNTTPHTTGLRVLLPAILAVTAALVGPAAHADKVSEAFALCKDAARQAHGDDSLVRLQRVRERAGDVRVKLKISHAGSRFASQCLVTADGDVRYQPPVEAAIAAESR